MKSPLNHHQSPQKQVEKASQTPASIAASLLHSVGSGKHRVPGGWGGGWSNVSHHPNIGDCSSPDTCFSDVKQISKMGYIPNPVYPFPNMVNMVYNSKYGKSPSNIVNMLGKNHEE